MPNQPLRRAVSLEEMKQKSQHFRSDESQQRGLEFVPELSDIFISPYAKSGTTWLQQIVHSLRTRGDMDFDEIMEVIPWLEQAFDLGVDVHAPQKAHPRAFKSHMTWDNIPKGARYIYSVRDPKDVMVSDYNFLGGWFFEKDAIPIEAFIHDQFLESNSYWKHINSWWSQRDNPDVLFLCFEDMRQDLAGTIQMIAQFMSIELDDELFDIVKEHASFEFMKAHKRQFDDHIIRDNINEKMGLPPDASTSKVKNGRVGDHKQALSPEFIQVIDSRWNEWIRPEYGLDSYEHMQDKIRDIHMKNSSRNIN